MTSIRNITIGAGKDYPTLAACISDRNGINLVSDDVVEQWLLYPSTETVDGAGGNSLTVNLTTDDTRYLIIRNSENSDGVAGGSNHYKLVINGMDTTTQGLLNISARYAIISGIELRATNNNGATNTAGLTYAASSGNGYFAAYNNIIHGFYNGIIVDQLLAPAWTGEVRIERNVIYDIVAKNGTSDGYPLILKKTGGTSGNIVYTSLLVHGNIFNSYPSGDRSMRVNYTSSFGTPSFTLQSMCNNVFIGTGSVRTSNFSFSAGQNVHNYCEVNNSAGLFGSGSASGIVGTGWGFRDSGNGDYRLLENSILIDGGVNLVDYIGHDNLVDMRGTTITGLWDVGAFEYYLIVDAAGDVYGMGSDYTLLTDNSRQRAQAGGFTAYGKRGYNLRHAADSRVITINPASRRVLSLPDNDNTQKIDNSKSLPNYNDPNSIKGIQISESNDVVQQGIHSVDSIRTTKINTVGGYDYISGQPVSGTSVVNESIKMDPTSPIVPTKSNPGRIRFNMGGRTPLYEEFGG